ncbi:MAG: DUF3137 domain-containing protein [Clostridia bacterium]|nr:DUF3137 domain-containing protein [Clostridia bacterium]
MNKEWENEFNIFYEEYTGKINEYYEEINKKKNKTIVAASMIIIALIIVFLLGTYEINNIIPNGYILQIIGGILIIVVSCGAVVLKIKQELSSKSIDIIHNIIKNISKDDNCFFNPKNRINNKNIEEMGLFNLNNLKYNGRNAIAANYNGNMMNFADMELFYFKDKVREEVYYDSQGIKHIKTIKSKIKKEFFSGCYISATLNKKIADHIYLIPNNLKEIVINGTINEYIKYPGEKLELENLEFSEKYRVYSKDEIQARYILSLKLMEQINQIDDILPGKKYIVFKEGRRFAICIQDFKIEDLKKTTLPLNKNSEKLKSNIRYIYKNIYKLFEIYNILDLGNDLYVNNYVDKK